MLNHGADWRLTTKTGNWTSLMYAAEGGFTKIVYRILHWKRKPRTGKSLYAPESDARDQINYTETHAHRSRNPSEEKLSDKTSSIPSLPILPGISPPPTGKSAKQPSLHSLALGKLASSSIKHKAAVRVVDRNGGHAPSIQHYHGTAFTPSADALTSKLGRVSHQEDKNRKRSTVDRSHFGRGGSTLSRHKLEMVITRESHTGCNALHLAARFGHVGW